MDKNAIANSFKGIGTKLKEFWQKYSASQKRMMIILSVVVIVLLAFLVWFLNQTQYGVLYSNLEAGEAGQIVQQLEEMGVTVKTKGDDTVLVPQDQVDRLRMEMAASGLPENSANLNILEQGSGFGITEEDKAVYRRYQLQQDLQNAIKTFSSVADARVSLITQSESSFVIQDRITPATAAVLLTLRPGSELSEQNVRAITELVQRSVPNLTKENITVIDSQMNVLSSNDGSDQMNSENQQTLQTQVSERLKKQINDLLQPVFGVGKVMTEVNVTLNFDDAVVESVRFEPMEGSTNGIIASIDQIREVANEAAEVGGEAGTGDNGADVPVYPVVDTGNSIYEKNSETINYEINTIKETLSKAKGSIEDLSVSVILDSRDIEPGMDYSENVVNLVSAAVGVDPQYIAVETLPFNGLEEAATTWESYNELNEQMQRWQMIRFFIILGVVLIVVVILIILLARRGKKSPEREVDQMFPSLSPEAAQILSAAEVTVDETGRPLPKEKKHRERDELEQYIDNNPDLVANILRSWLNSD